MPFTGDIANDGSDWANTVGCFTYATDELRRMTINAADQDDMGLNDYANGENTQQLAEAIGHYPAGTVVEGQFEITVTAMIDGEEREYKLVAVSADGKVQGYTFKGEWPPTDAMMTPVRNHTGDNKSLNIPQTNVPCFARGVMIATPTGEVAIEDLREGDLVLTRDHGAQPIRWIGATALDADRLANNEKLRPVRIMAGALGKDQPAQDLLVSPQHRVLVRSRIATKMFGATEVLVAAKQLLQLEGINIATDLVEVEYFHMLFDQHEVVISNGAQTESLYPGPEALKAVGPAAVEEIYALFPELRGMDMPVPARPLLTGRQGRKLAVRHAQHARALLF